MANTGLGSQFGLKKETTWGTAVTVDKFYPFESETLSLDQTYVDPLGLQAGITFSPQSLTKATTRRAAGGVTMYVPYKQLGHILDQMVAGTITPVQQGATPAYLSTFNVGASVPTKSATLQVNKPAVNTGDIAFTYPGAVLESAEFTMETGGILMANWGWAAKDETTPSTTPAGAALAAATYAASNNVWAHQDTTLLYNGATTGVGVTGVSLQWNQPYAAERYHLDGSGTPAKPVPNGVASVTGTLSGEFYDNVYYNAYRGGGFASLVITFAGQTAISGSFYPTVKFTLPAVQLRGSSPQVGSADLLDQSIPFVAKFDGTNPPCKIEYTSTETAAW